MNENTPAHLFPRRGRLAHYAPIEQNNRSIIVFLTVCTKDRRPILANEKVHAQIREAWAASEHWLVGRYLVMPDHIHLFCTPGVLPIPSFVKWERYWKSRVTRSAGAKEGTFWQKDYWDTQLRQNDSYAAKWDYVKNNPVRAALVKRSEDWPYQGELNVLRWHT